MSRDRESSRRDFGQGRWGRNRREFLQALGGAIGVALASDRSTIEGLAEGAARKGKGKSKLPSGYVFHRVLSVGLNSPGDGDVVEILPGVMINDRSEVIYHAKTSAGATGVYRMQIGRSRKPGAATPSLIVQTGQTLSDGVVVHRIGAGDTNRFGTYVTVISAKGSLNGVYIQRPGQAFQPLFKSGGRGPGGARYTGHFGDIDLSNGGDILMVARYTLPGELRQGLVHLPRGTTGKPGRGRILLRSGHRIPNSRALITGLGLVERRGPYFIQQVFGRQAKHRARHDFKLEPTGFVSGKLSKGRRGTRLLVGSKLFKPGRKAVQGDALVGPRVHKDGTAATVTHKRGSRLELHLHTGGGNHARIANTGGKGSGGEIKTISAPIFGPDGLFFYRTISKNAMELLVVAGDERRRILDSGDKISGSRVRGFNFGWHTDQVDNRGRLAFQAQFEDGSTGIVIGTPT